VSYVPPHVALKLPSISSFFYYILHLPTAHNFKSRKKEGLLIGLPLAKQEIDFVALQGKEIPHNGKL